MGQRPSREADLDHLPAQWLFYLDPCSLLRVQSAGLRIDEALRERIWKELCAQELGVPVEQLHGTGACWRRLFYDLDVSTVQNELRSKAEDYEFLPSLYGEEAQAPEGIGFAGPRSLQCRLWPSYLGRDRCVLARWPLASPFCATALWLENHWQLAYRKTAYYEVSIGSEVEMEAVLPCISVGLCSPRFPRHAVSRQQAGWDSESWALHSDDGLLFHTSNRGYAAENICSFGRGDVLGCGLYHEIKPGEVARRIFYTLNGRFLGYAFEVDVPQDVPLWPCVGLDTKQWLTFNFGRVPFLFDLDSLCSEGAAEVRCPAEQGRVAAKEAMRPLVSKLAPRRFFSAEEAEAVVRNYQEQPRWLDAVDRLVNATLVDATDTRGWRREAT